MDFIRLGDIAEFRNGLNFSKESKGAGCTIIGVPDFKDYFTPKYYDLKQIDPTGIVKKDDYMEKEDVLFVRSNGNKELVGRSLFVDQNIEAVHSGFCIRVRIKTPQILPKFFAYYSRSKTFRSLISTISGGTNIQNLNQRILSEVLIPAFSISEQKRVIGVLDLLFNKISLNNRINQELEAMAKLIYDYWFVQFDFPTSAAYAASVGRAKMEGQPYKSSGGKMVYNEKLKREIPEGWEVKPFKEWVSHDKSGDWGKESEQGNYILEVSCIRGADINGINGKGEVKAPKRFILEKNSHKLLNDGGIIVEISGGSPTQSTGRLAFITEEVLMRFNEPLICSNFCRTVTLDNPKSLYNFVYEWNRLYDAGVLFGWEGKTSGIKNLLFDSFISKYNFPVPPEKSMEEFFYRLNPFHSMIQKNLQQNQKLSELRDWLLPMLMNGQVTIKEAEEQLSIVAEPETPYNK